MSIGVICILGLIDLYRWIWTSRVPTGTKIPPGRCSSDWFIGMPPLWKAIPWDPWGGGGGRVKSIFACRIFGGRTIHFHIYQHAETSFTILFYVAIIFVLCVWCREHFCKEKHLLVGLWWFDAVKSRTPRSCFPPCSKVERSSWKVKRNLEDDFVLEVDWLLIWTNLWRSTKAADVLLVRFFFPTADLSVYPPPKEAVQVDRIVQ